MRIDRHAIGERAEDLAAGFLREQGYDVLAQRLRVGRLELDIVARRGDLAVLVEVRTRRGGAYRGALASVTPLKRARLLRAAERLWRFQLRRIPDIGRMRIDVIAVTYGPSGPSFVHVEGAIVAGVNARM